MVLSELLVRFAVLLDMRERHERLVPQVALDLAIHRVQLLQIYYRLPLCRPVRRNLLNLMQGKADVIKFLFFGRIRLDGLQVMGESAALLIVMLA